MMAVSLQAASPQPDPASQRMRLEDIAPGQFLEGIAPGFSARVLAVDEPAPETLAVVYRDPAGTLGERLLSRADEPWVHVPTRGRPWAFDADGNAFKRALGVCLEPLSPGVGNAGPRGVAEHERSRMDAFAAVRRGTFLVDPDLPGLVPYMMLVLGHGPRPGDGASGARAILARALPAGGFSIADPSAHRRLLAPRPEDRAILHEALRPLLANVRLRNAAVAWFAARLVAERDSSSPPGSPWSPPRALPPPVLHGGAVVVAAGFLPWLRQPDPASEGIPAEP